MFGSKKFNNNRNNFERKNDDNNQNNNEENLKPISICSICNSPVKSIYTSIKHRDTNEYVHFDCVIRELIKEYRHKLGRNLKIYYIGAGDFAIVREVLDKMGYLKTFEVVERIEYEKKD